MPNWVRNVVKVSENTMSKIKKKFFIDDKFQFDKVIPMPKDLMITSGSVTHDAILYALALKSPDEIMKTSKKLIEKGYKMSMEDFEVFINDNKLEKLKAKARKYVPDITERELGLNTLEKFGNHCLNNFKKYGEVDWYEWSWKNWGTKWDIGNSFWCNRDTMIFNTAWATPIPIFEALSKVFPNELIKVEFADEDIYGGNVGILHFKNGEMVNSVEKNVDFARNVWSYQLDENEADELESEY